ncbi:NapC/NirT family cytochrome c [Magnetococcales bacterium HHB-1]
MKSLWNALWTPSAKFSLGLLLIVGFVAGGIFFLVFHFTMNATNSMELCVSCHEMDGVYEEYKETVHYKNRTGVRATCADCHVPHGKTFGQWLTKIGVKATVGSKDIFNHLIGTYPDKASFEKARWKMAQDVIAHMKENNSRECRHCHDFEAMQFDEQNKSAAKKHQKATKEGKTCIDCHTGIAHEEPEDPNDTDGEDEEEGMEDEGAEEEAATE